MQRRRSGTADPGGAATHNFFTVPELDRLSSKRGDAAWVSEQLSDPRTCVLPVWQDRNLFRHGDDLQPATIPATDLLNADSVEASFVLLGRLRGTVLFAAELASCGATAPPWTERHGLFRSLRTIAPLLGRRDSGLLAYARGMVYWHRRNRFCGDCGSRTLSASAGHLLECTSPDCGAQHFPRTDPAVITVVTHEGRCLFGRQRTWPPAMYSIIAGFVEPGESLEVAVAREVYEETGVRVTDVEYRSSQPWPFPSSLMLGFTAHAVSTEITLGDNELEDARWMSRGELADELTGDRFRLPSTSSISFRLITEWFDDGLPGSLDQLLSSALARGRRA